MKITVCNWDNFQLRKDVKVSSWFRFEHNFFTDHKFFTLDNDEKIIWINILCTASMESKSEIFYNLELASRLTNVKVHKIENTLEKLKQFQCIDYQTRTRTVHDTDTCLQTDKQTDRQTDNSTQACPHFLGKVLDLWNKNCSEFGMPKVKSLNAERKKRLKKAVKDFSEIGDWIKIFNVAATKGFTGKDGRVFTPNWDYIFRNNNYLKFYEEHDVIFNDNQLDQTQIEKNVVNHILSQM